MWPFGIWHLPPWMGRVKTGTSLEKRISVCKFWRNLFLFTLKKSKREKSRAHIQTSAYILMWPQQTVIPVNVYLMFVILFTRARSLERKNLHHEIRGHRSRGCGRNSCYGRTKDPDRHFMCLDLSRNIYTWSGNIMKFSCPVHEQNQNIHIWIAHR